MTGNFIMFFNRLFRKKSDKRFVTLIPGVSCIMTRYAMLMSIMV